MKHCILYRFKRPLNFVTRSITMKKEAHSNFENIARTRLNNWL